MFVTSSIKAAQFCMLGCPNSGTQRSHSINACQNKAWTVVQGADQGC